MCIIIIIILFYFICYHFIKATTPRLNNITDCSINLTLLFFFLFTLLLLLLLLLSTVFVNAPYVDV